MDKIDISLSVIISRGLGHGAVTSVSLEYLSNQFLPGLADRFICRVCRLLHLPGRFGSVITTT